MAEGGSPNGLYRDEGGGKNQEQRKKAVSYADRLKTNIRYDQRLKRNVLDIEIEKLDRDNEIILDQACVARLMTSIGINIKTQYQGYQVMYGRGGATISVWCVPGIDLERFCRTETIQVTRGVWTKNIRPAGRRDVVVTVSGLDFNTPDSLVKGYIEKFGGKLVNQEVIYGKHGDGPLQGGFNGDRKYNVEFSDSAKSMGTYHFLDGAKVRIYYRGNKKTCGRCHAVAGSCLGEGFAKDCHTNGGERVDLADHMRTIWQEIGFTPSSFELPAQADPKASEDLKLEGDTAISEETSFRRNIDRPEMKDEDVKKVIGMQIRNFPPTLTEEEIVKFIVEHVDKDITMERVSFRKNEHSMNAAIENGMEGTKVIAAAKEIDFTKSKKKYFGKPLYFRILKNLTPEKPEVLPSPVATPSKPPMKTLQFGKPGNNQIGTVKEKMKALEDKVDEKKPKTKSVKIVEFGLTNTTTQQPKRTHTDVGSPTSPEAKKSPKKPKGGDKNIKK